MEHLTRENTKATLRQAMTFAVLGMAQIDMHLDQRSSAKNPEPETQ